MKSRYLAGVYLLCALGMAACESTPKYIPVEQIPAGNYAEMHVDKTYDFVYLAVFDTLNGLNSWAPDLTLKDDGLIRLHNTRFSGLDDADRRIINIRIRRDNPNQTSVFLDPDSRRVVGADDVLAMIRKKLGVPAV